MKRFLQAALFVIAFPAWSQTIGSVQLVKKTVIGYNDTTKLTFLHDASLYRDGWNTLPQTVFWREIINLTADTMLINVPSCRQTLTKVSRDNWMDLTEEDKKVIKDSLACINNLQENALLYVTAGKGEFYELKKVMPNISRAINVFVKNDVDPWYAQTILLIESPGKTKAKSSVGANGPFQLMKAVAQKYGLVVNRHRDDRSNIDKAALAASKFIKAVCIPQIKSQLTDVGLKYNETDLWFRLLVLHAYHAGPGNVRCALNMLQPKKGGIDLMQKLWQTECKGFKNESQNYSQIALASITNFEEMIKMDGDTVFLVTGDKLYRKYNKNTPKATAFGYLNQCLLNYENDFVDGVIPYDPFMKKVSQIRKDMKQVSPTDANAGKLYPAPEAQLLSICKRLINKQRYDEAIKLLKINLETHPKSPDTFQLMAKAYLLSGNKQMAAVYNSRSEELRGNTQ